MSRKEPLTQRQIAGKILKYAVTVAIGVLMVYTTLKLQNFFTTKQTALSSYFILHNAFVIPGVVITLVGVLVVLSNEGSFDGIGYALKYAFTMLLPGALHKREQVTFREYIESKRAKGKVKGFGFLLIVGLIFFAISLIFLALYYYEGSLLTNTAQ